MQFGADDLTGNQIGERHSQLLNIEKVNKLARVNGTETILLNIFKQGDANAISLSENVMETASELESDYTSSGLAIKIVSDTSNFTRDSIKSVLTDLLLAIILVTLVILVFLHNWRNALIVMIVVPVSLIGSFIGMQLFNFTLNLMSLLGMSVVIGVLVDDAIVVVKTFTGTRNGQEARKQLSMQ